MSARTFLEAVLALPTGLERRRFHGSGTSQGANWGDIHVQRQGSRVWWDTGCIL
jgi:hypothetical protein